MNRQGRADFRTEYRTEDTGQFAEAIAEAEKRRFSEPWSLGAVKDFLSYPYNHAVVSLTDSVFSGYITYTFLAGEIQIANVAVLPEFRRKGIADGLLDALFTWVEKHEAERAGLEVRASNVPARALYEKNGFVVVGTRRNFYKNPTEDAVLYDRYFQ